MHIYNTDDLPPITVVLIANPKKFVVTSDRLNDIETEAPLIRAELMESIAHHTDKSAEEAGRMADNFIDVLYKQRGITRAPTQ